MMSRIQRHICMVVLRLINAVSCKLHKFRLILYFFVFFFFSSRRRHTRYWRDWSSDVCSSDLEEENRRAAREAAKGKKAHEGGEYTPMPYAEAAAPEIRVDPAYFEKRAQMLSEESGLELTPAAMGSGYGSDLDALNEELTPLDDPRIERARESFAPEETEKDEADANSAVSRVLQIFHRSKDS